MGALATYGDGLALVTVTRTAAPPDRVVASVAAATARPVRVVVADIAGAPVPNGAGVIRLREDVGRAAAVNRAVAGLDGDVGWVAVADPQVEWGAGALDALLAATARYPRAGALGPRLCDPAGVVIASAGALPTLRDALLGRVPRRAVTGGPLGWLSGAGLLVRRAAWDSVDGYDPRYAGDGEAADLADVDLADRLGRAGWLVVGVPAAEATYHGRGRQGILESRDRALRRYVRDRHPAPARALLALVRRG